MTEVGAISTYYTDSNKEADQYLSQVPALRLADLIEEISTTLTRYIHFSNPMLATLLACWIAMTYCFEEFYYSGYLAIRSAKPGSGKTRLLDLISAFSKGNPPVVTNPTAAVLYRTDQKVFIIDEVDRLRAQDKQTHGAVLATLNAGFERKGAVPRTEKDKDGQFIVKNHSVYGPKAFAGLQNLDESLADRCFHIEMQKSPVRPERISMRWYEDKARGLRADLMKWFDDNRDSIATAYSNLPTELKFLSRYDDRFQDISEPLILIAAVADAEYGSGPRILNALLEAFQIASGQRQPTTGARLAAVLEPIFRAELGNRDEVFIPSTRLQEKAQVAGLNWIDSAQDLSAALSQFGLSSRSNGTIRGYDVSKEIVENMVTVSL